MNQHHFNRAGFQEPEANVEAEMRNAAAPQVFSIDRVDFRIARNRDEYSGAFSLLHRRYCETGLDSPSPGSHLRVMPYHLWPQTQVFVATQRKKVIGTVSLTYPDQGREIPMQSTFKDKVRNLEDRGLTFGEVCSLSVESPSNQSTGAIFGGLTRLMMFHARAIGLDVILAVVHPRHAKFYQRAMGFQTIGDVKEYAQAAGQPGVPVLGSVNDRSTYRPRWRRYYFEGDFSSNELVPAHMTDSDLNYFGRFVSRDGENESARRAA